MITFTVDGIQEMITRLGYVERGVVDLRQLGTWDWVQTEFYKIEKEQFDSEGSSGASGKWAALTPKYATWKQKKYGSLPILQLTGKLYKEMTTEAGVVEKKAQEMTLGTRLPYAGYHQGGKKPRPPLSMTPEQEDMLAEPVRKKMKQLIQNAGLSDLRGF
jgi:phage gpG-like protein